MPETIDQEDLRTSSARLIAAVVAGETFIVTRNGQPVAELRPIGDTRRQFVSRAEIIWRRARGPHADAAQLRADLDRVIDPSL